MRGAAVTILAQQLAAALLLVPRSLRYLTRTGMGFFTRGELHEFLVFSTKVQVVGWATLFLQEISAVVIGAVLPVRNVAVFNAGASFATQLRGVPINVIPPIQTTLGHALGRGGEDALVTEARRLQRFWIIGITGWCAAAGPACYFGIRAWLGPQFHASGIIALAMMLGSVFYLSTKVLTTTLTVSGRPGFEARYCVAMVVVNLVLLPAGVALGPVGVVSAAVVAQAASAAYLGRIVRREWSTSRISLSADVPLPRSGHHRGGRDSARAGHPPDRPRRRAGAAVVRTARRSRASGVRAPRPGQAGSCGPAPPSRRPAAPQAGRSVPRPTSSRGS